MRDRPLLLANERAPAGLTRALCLQTTAIRRPREKFESGKGFIHLFPFTFMFSVCCE